MKQVWCEWDIGQHGLVFKNEYVAERWLRNNHILRSLAVEDEMPFEDYYQDLVDNCLIGIEDLQVIE